MPMLEAVMVSLARFVVGLEQIAWVDDSPRSNGWPIVKASSREITLKLSDSAASSPNISSAPEASLGIWTCRSQVYLAHRIFLTWRTRLSSC